MESARWMEKERWKASFYWLVFNDFKYNDFIYENGTILFLSIILFHKIKNNILQFISSEDPPFPPPNKKFIV